MVRADSLGAARPYGGRMDDQPEPASGPPAAFQAEGGEHLAPVERREAAGGFQAESQEHATPPAAPR